MKVTYINPNLAPNDTEFIINNVDEIKSERVNRFDVEYDIITCIKTENGQTKYTELDLLGNTKIIIERD